MRLKLRHIAFWSSLVLLLTATGILCGCACRDRSRVLCDTVDVRFPDRRNFISEEDVKEMLDKNYGVYIGVRLDSLDLGRMESILEEQGAVLKSEAWTTFDGVLHISIQQRKPALRFRRGDKEYIMDRTGYVFPMNAGNCDDVPMIEGGTPSADNPRWEAWAQGAIAAVDYFYGSKQWGDRVEKIGCNASGDLELRLKDCRERFIIGFPDDLDSKMERLGKYFSHIRPSKAPGYYKSVNLKYNKQIICRKDI